MERFTVFYNTIETGTVSLLWTKNIGFASIPFSIKRGCTVSIQSKMAKKTVTGPGLEP